MKKAVAYYRVSRPRQGKSGLGLAAQKNDVHYFARASKMKLIKEFVEVVSGMKSHRLKVEEAIEYCRRRKATLLIATLDRLARKVLFIALLIENKVDFVAVDDPHADTYTTFIKAARAQEESERAGKRTKAALAIAKRRGVRLGKFGKILAKRNKRRSEEFKQRMKPQIEKLRRLGFRTARAIADELNRRKIRTYRKKGTWHTGTIYVLLRRI